MLHIVYADLHYLSGVESEGSFWGVPVANDSVPFLAIIIPQPNLALSDAAINFYPLDACLGTWTFYLFLRCRRRIGFPLADGHSRWGPCGAHAGGYTAGNVPVTTGWINYVLLFDAIAHDDRTALVSRAVAAAATFWTAKEF